MSSRLRNILFACCLFSLSMLMLVGLVLEPFDSLFNALGKGRMSVHGQGDVVNVGLGRYCQAGFADDV